MSRFWKLVAIGAVTEAAWATTVVVLPNGLLRGLVLVAGLPALYATLELAKRILR
jgi:hypothetical protein